MGLVADRRYPATILRARLSRRSGWRPALTERPSSLSTGAGVFALEDFIVHELTHVRQAQLLREHKGEWGWSQTGGTQRRSCGLACPGEAAGARRSPKG